MGRISMPQGRGSQLHNRREYEKIGKPTPDNIDVTKSNENITLVDRDIREAYEEIFGEALAAYNSKQRRADRKIENYYDHIQKSKNGEKLFYEDVVQWGSKEDFENPQTRAIARKALVSYAVSFEARNPNLKLIGAYIHMDEASPHLHIDYIPVAHGYTRGLATRNSLDRAMKAMGFEPEKESRQNNATKLWKENERARFADICRSLGLEVEEERAARGSLSVEEYKEARDKMFGELDQELQEARDELGAAKGEAKAVYDALKPLVGIKAELDASSVPVLPVALKPNEVRMKRADYEMMKKNSDAYIANRPRLDAVDKREKAVAKRESRADQRDKELTQREQKVTALEELPTRFKNLEENNLYLHKQWNKAEQENRLLRRMLGMIKFAVKKLLSLGQGVTVAQQLFASAIEDYIGNKGVVDVKDALHNPIEERYQEKVKEREEQARLEQAREEALRRQRQQEARARQQENEGNTSPTR